MDFDDPKELNSPQLFNDPIKFQLEVRTFRFQKSAVTAWHLNLQRSFLSKILVRFRTTFWSWMLRIKTISKKPHPLESLPWVCETGPIWPEQSYGVTRHWLSMSTRWWLFNPIQSILITIPIMTTKIVTTKKNLNLTQHLSPKLAIPGPCRIVWGHFFPMHKWAISCSRRGQNEFDLIK